MGKAKFLLPIRLCIFLMQAMVMMYARQFFFVATGQWVLDMISLTFTNSHIESQTRLLHWLFLRNDETCSLWQITTNYAERIIWPQSMQLNPMRGLLSLKSFCLTAILLTAVIAKTGMRTIWVRHWLTTKNTKHIKSTAFHILLKGTECSCQSATKKFMEKKHVLNYSLHSEIDICLCNDCGFARYVCNVCKCSHINLREFKCVQCLVKNLHEQNDHECDYLQSHSFI